jgi:choline dehydrogenase-like flavoprotein
MSSWYDHVERFAGITGERLGLAQLPDGEFQPAMDLNAVEKHLKAQIEQRFPGRHLTMGRIAHLTQPTEEQLELGRGPCQYRNLCTRGCSYGAYFSSLSATLPAAQRTGNLTVVTDAIGHSVIYDPVTGRASGVRVVDANTKEAREYTGRVVFMCASAIATAAILLNSTSERFPNGLANDSDQVGRNLMDHVSGIRTTGQITGFEDRYFEGRRPGGFYIPRYRNLSRGAQEEEFVRGFGHQGGAGRAGWERGAHAAGIGEELKTAMRTPGGWTLSLSGFGEMLPRADNRVTLNRNRRDNWDIPIGSPRRGRAGTRRPPGDPASLACGRCCRPRSDGTPRGADPRPVPP